MRADGDGTPIKYFDIQLENVLISGMAPSLIAGTMLSEHVSLKYSKIKWTYIQQNIAGAGAPRVTRLAGETWQQTRLQHSVDIPLDDEAHQLRGSAFDVCDVCPDADRQPDSRHRETKNLRDVSQNLTECFTQSRA